MDILSGRSFDLLYVGDWLDMTSMYNKNILCDLNELIASDPEISRDIYVEPVLDALEVNGKLYQMPRNFNIESAVVKADKWIFHLIHSAFLISFPLNLSILTTAPAILPTDGLKIFLS